MTDGALPSARLKELGEPGRVLDVGCGNGRNSVELLSAGWEVVALDIDVSGVRGLDGVFLHVVRADANAMPFRAESFDAVLDSFTYTFLDKEKYAAEVARLLKEGGTLLLEFDDDPHVRGYPELLMMAEPVVRRLRLERLWLLGHAWGDIQVETRQVPFLALLLIKRSSAAARSTLSS